jgi:hypothetical protein
MYQVAEAKALVCYVQGGYSLSLTLPEDDRY